MTAELGGLLSDAAVYWGLGLSLWVSFRVLRYPDLSLEQLFVLGGAAYALAVRSAVPLPVCLLLMVPLALVMGFACSALRNKLGVDAILLSLGLSYVYYSVTLAGLGAPNVYFGERGSEWGASAGYAVPLAVFALGSAVLVFLVHTRWGMKVVASGSNPDLAASHGIDPVFWQGLGLGGAFFLGLSSGALFAWRSGYVDVSSGSGLLLVTIFVVMVSRLVQPRIRPAVSGPLLLALFAGYLGVLQLLLQGGLAPQWLKGVNGAALLALVLLVPRSRQMALSL